MRFVIGIPIVLSIAGFVLAMLALFAGQKPGFMEEYHIIMLNTSELGHNLIPTPSNGNAPSTTTGASGVGGFFGSLVASATAAAGAAESKLADFADDIVDDIADKLAEKLGIMEFYSIHAMTSCEGDFSPNATTPGAGYNVTNCTAPLESGRYNISAQLDHELGVGPVHLNLADLGWSKDLQSELDKLPGLLLALAVFYIIGAGTAGLTMLLSAAGLFTYARHPRLTSLANACSSSLSALTLLIGNLITTIGGKKAADAINQYGDDIGLAASAGGKFMAIAWSAFAVMLVTAGYWAYELLAVIKARRRGGKRHNKFIERHSMEERSPHP